MLADSLLTTYDDDDHDRSMSICMNWRWVLATLEIAAKGNWCSMGGKPALAGMMSTTLRNDDDDDGHFGVSDEGFCIFSLYLPRHSMHIYQGWHGSQPVQTAWRVSHKRRSWGIRVLSIVIVFVVCLLFSTLFFGRSVRMG